MSPDWPIETDRLLLRPYDEGDFDALHALYADAEVVRWLYYEPDTVEHTRNRLARKIAARDINDDPASGLQVAVALRDGSYVGDIVLFYGSVEHRDLELGFAFDRRHQGHGYATEAARAIVDWAFSAGFHRIHGRLEPRNLGSARVLERLGMRKEALFVENEWVKGEWQSEAVYAILEREWRR